MHYGAAHHPRVIVRADSLALASYEALLAILARLGGDVSELPRPEPISMEWYDEILAAAVHEANQRQAQQERDDLMRGLQREAGR